jgi:hypothetical protein
MREAGPNHLGAVLRVTLACAVAAPVAYYFVAGNPFAPSQTLRGSKLASVETQYAEPTQPRLPESPQVQPLQIQPLQVQPLQGQPLQGQPVPVRAPQTQTLAVQTPVTQVPSRWPGEAPSVDKAPPRAEPPAVPQVTAPPPAAKPVRAMDREEIALLLKQGEQFIAAGDVVTARIVFRRAAEAGDAAGALAMGATYDPGVLERLGVRGIAADVGQARSWYEKAREAGSPEALRRLELLASR